jgi:predicted ArsR family transcriptional regulator
MRDHEEDAVTAVAALGDPLRRRLYRFVGEQDHPVSRDEAAAGVGISRSAAAFHLDRLVEDGLLETEFRRLTGRRGPGAGRPAKLYRRVAEEIAVSLPARRYDVAAALLAAAVSEAGASGQPVGPILERLARAHGAALAAAAAAPAGGRATVTEVLADEGYEPRLVEEDVLLANCPFHVLVTEHRQLVCRMNLALLEGFTAALPEAGLTARLQPTDGACCVRLCRPRLTGASATAPR